MASARKVALITGASAGIGLACANRLDSAGWVVVGASRRGTSTGAWSGLVMDVDNDTSVRNGVAGLIESHGRVDALVAAAGWGLAGAVELTSLEEAEAQLQTNFWGAVRTVQAVLPTMRRQGGGHVVLVSSIGGLIGIPFQAFYSASKFALEGMAEAMAYEVEPFDIAVTLIEPGNVATDFTASRRMAKGGDSDDAYSEALRKAVGVMEHDEVNGVAPAAVAATIHKVLGARHPPRRVSVGKTNERVGLLAKRLLPFRVFQGAAKSSLGVD